MADGWSEVALRDVCTVVVDRREASDVDGVPYVGLEHMPSGSPRVLQRGITGSLAGQVVGFQQDDVLFGRLRPYLKKVAWADFAGVCSPEILVLRPLADRVLPGYLYTLATSDPVIDWAVCASAGSRMPRTAAQDLLTFPVPLPPLDEQRRIVDLLGALDVVAERAQDVVVSASTTMEAVDRAVCARIASAPTVALADIADVMGGLTKDAKRDADPNLVDVPYLRVANVQRGWLDLSEMAIIKAPPSKVAALRLRVGDVLFNEGGDRDKLGRGWVWEGQLDPCIHQNHVLRARLTNAEFDPWFIAIWGNGPFGRVWFEENGSQTTNLASVSLSTLRRFPVPAIPIVDQHKIAAEHLAIREVSRSATAVRERALAARAALATHLLSGAHEIPASYDRFLDGAA
jgi:type I restriction enzyme S subunit